MSFPGSTLDDISANSIAKGAGESAYGVREALTEIVPGTRLRPRSWHVRWSLCQCWGGSQSGWKGHLIRHLRYAIVCIQEGRRFNSWDPCLHCWKVWRRNSHPPRNSRFTMPVLKINGLSVCSDGAGCSRKTAPPLNAMGLQIQSRFKTKQLPIESCLRTCRNTPAVWVSSTRKTENQLNQLGFHRDDLFEANAHGHKSVSNLPFTKPGVSMCFLRCHWGTSPHRLATKPEATAKKLHPRRLLHMSAKRRRWSVCILFKGLFKTPIYFYFLISSRSPGQVLRANNPGV